jgi:phage terminase large subunit
MEALRLLGTGARLFYGGARGGGKSYLSLAAAVIVCLQYPKLRAVIVRKTYPELQDNFISVLRNKFPPEIFGYKYRVSEKSATFDNGSQILFRSCETEEDTRKVQGVEYQLMIIDEANNFESRIIDRFVGSLRGNTSMKFIPTLIMTGNPGGYADEYFKTRYVNPDYRKWTEPELRNKDKYIFVSAKLDDNPSVDDSYKDMLDTLPDDLRRAWRDGDWSIFEGMFFTEWNPGEHIVTPFEIPEHWERVMSLDLGFTEDHPTVAIFTAQDPETLKLYVYDEYVGVGSIDRYIDELKPIMGEQQYKGIFADPSMFYNNTLRSEMD